MFTTIILDAIGKRVDIEFNTGEKLLNIFVAGYDEGTIIVDLDDHDGGDYSYINLATISDIRIVN